MTPSARTLARLKALGYSRDTVERWVKIPGEDDQPPREIKRDCFRVADVLAVNRRTKDFLLVQATTLGNVSHRVAKVREVLAKGDTRLRDWLAAGGRFEVWGWVQRGLRWRVKIVELRGEDLAAVVVQAPRRRVAVKRMDQGELF